MGSNRGKISLITLSIQELKINLIVKIINFIYNYIIYGRVKCICLNDAGLSLFTNVSNLKTKDKKKLVAQITKLFEEGNDDEIIRRFNEIATEQLWSDGSGEYLKSPIYNNGIVYFD
jgi:hypothetical protein